MLSTSDRFRFLEKIANATHASHFLPASQLVSRQRRPALAGATLWLSRCSLSSTQILVRIVAARDLAQRLGIICGNCSPAFKRAEEDALLAWLTTVPTTMVGVIATLEHASHRPYVSDYPHNYVYANLAESAQYSDGVFDGWQTL